MTIPAPTGEPRRPASAARAEASRRNSARSRGPVTAAGKARSARNALRHGLTASVHLVTRGEDPQAVAALREGLRAELGAHGLLASCLVDRLALALWKLARADRLEVALATIEPRCPTGRLWPEIGLPRLLSRVHELGLLLRYQAQLGRELHRLLRLLNDPAFDRLLGAPSDADAADAPEAGGPEGGPTDGGEADPPEPGTPGDPAADPDESAADEPADAAPDVDTADCTAAAASPDRDGGFARPPAVLGPPAPRPDAPPEPAARSAARLAGPGGPAPTPPLLAPADLSTVAERLLAKGDLAGFLRVERDLRRSGGVSLRPAAFAAPPPAGPAPSVVAGVGRHGPIADAAPIGRAAELAATAAAGPVRNWRNEPEPTVAPTASSPDSSPPSWVCDPSSVMVGPRSDHPAPAPSSSGAEPNTHAFVPSSSPGADPGIHSSGMAGSAAGHDDGQESALASSPSSPGSTRGSSPPASQTPTGGHDEKGTTAGGLRTDPPLPEPPDWPFSPDDEPTTARDARAARAPRPAPAGKTTTPTPPPNRRPGPPPAWARSPPGGIGRSRR